MAFNKEAQRAKVQQMEAGLPPINKTAEKSVRVFDGQIARIGDIVIYVKCVSGRVSLYKRKITDIRDNRVFMDGSYQGAKPDNIILYNK